MDNKKILPISIGGDHSITGGILQALGNGNLTKGSPVSLLHLDAHTDVFTKVSHFLGAKKSAAHWGAYLVDQGQVDPKTSISPVINWAPDIGKSSEDAASPLIIGGLVGLGGAANKSETRDKNIKCSNKELV